MVTRRALLKSAVALSATAAFGQTSRLAPGETAFEFRVRPGKPLATIPGDFIGLGYEMSSVARPGLLSVDNVPYVQMVRHLGSKGVLRFGGIVADFTRYSAGGNEIGQPKNTVITRASLHRLRAFLDVTGWTVIWSVNFGRGTLEEAIVEAKDVSRMLGPRLLAIELGNEVENYSRGSEPLRHPPYSYEEYRAEYTRWRTAIVAAVPGLSFAAPDTAASVEWVERMAADSHGDVQLLTTHYYRGNQKFATLDQLMHADPELKIKLERLRHASNESGLPWRMCETNSFFGGGRPGLSDTLAGALWILDYMLLLAQYGCAGVNMETGVNQLGFISSYSPIQDDGAGHNTAGAPYYGMLAFSAATADASNVLAVETVGDDTGVSMYGLGIGERLRNIVLINNTSDQSARVSLDHSGLDRPSALRLAGPSLDSTTGVTFGGAAVDALGHWTAAKPESVRTATVIVPPGSAVIIRSE